MTQSTEPIYRVVISDEGRYSIWPEYKEIPWGWRADAVAGTRQTCLDHIATVWTDMRPTSLQTALSNQAASDQTADQPTAEPTAFSSHD